MSNMENIPPVVNAHAVVDAATKEKEKRERNLWKPTEKSTLKDGKQILWHC
jgi:hypothetical protein